MIQLISCEDIWHIFALRLRARVPTTWWKVPTNNVRLEPSNEKIDRAHMMASDLRNLDTKLDQQYFEPEQR
jgi:hypothetical protein